MRKTVWLLMGCLLLLGSLPAGSPGAAPPPLRTAWGGEGAGGRGEAPSFPCAPLAWVIETVESSPAGIGVYTSLVLDGAGLPRIAYGSDAGVRYASFDGSAWQVQQVGENQFTGYPSLALDAGGLPRISHWGGSGNVRYASYDGSAWQYQDVDCCSDLIFTSLELDAQDLPRVSYYDLGIGALKYAAYDGMAWQTQTVDGPCCVGEYDSLALDSAGQPRISYYDLSGYLRYAAFDGSAWKVEVLDGPDVGRYTSLALDGGGHPRISYYDYTHGDLKYAAFDGSAWHTETVDGAGNVGRYTSLALDGAGLPRIAYYDWTNSNLKYACFDGSAWHTQTVDSRGGRYTSLVLDEAGLPRISYQGYNSPVDSAVQYARATGPCYAPAGAAFAAEPPLPAAGIPFTLAAAASGTLPISFTWDLGDGAAAAGSPIAHVYALAGSYTVTLTATNSCGSATVQDVLPVIPPYRIYLPLVPRARPP